MTLSVSEALYDSKNLDLFASNVFFLFIKSKKFIQIIIYYICKNIFLQLLYKEYLDCIN